MELCGLLTVYSLTDVFVLLLVCHFLSQGIFGSGAESPAPAKHPESKPHADTEG